MEKKRLDLNRVRTAGRALYPAIVELAKQVDEGVPDADTARGCLLEFLELNPEHEFDVDGTSATLWVRQGPPQGGQPHVGPVGDMLAEKEKEGAVEELAQPNADLAEQLDVIRLFGVRTQTL